ncbi:MAG: chloride channel protein [Bacillota bacterium]|nr:chloride channel protein [Bacillota bacterium]
MKDGIMKAEKYLRRFIYWFAIAALVGAVTGIVGALFHKAIEFATETRKANLWLVYLLPVGGIVISLLYKLSKEQLSTNTVIDCIREKHSSSPLLAPLIFIGTFITHLFGGSAGREGAALQIGGGIGSEIGKLLKLDKEKMSVIIVCGMSGAFSAIFTTPVTAAIFALEIVAVGHIRYFELMPCIVSSAIAYIISLSMGNGRLFYSTVVFPEISIMAFIKIALLSILCALISVLFCVTLSTAEKLMRKKFKSDYTRAFVGGLLIITLTLIVGNDDYNGAGMDVIKLALAGKAVYYAFILKLIFTAVTMASGFRGGEIVPALFVGATFGVSASFLFGIDPSFAAAIGMVCIFCGISNCPLASLMLGVELFGSEGLIFYAMASGVSYIMSGCFSLYNSQRIVYSKVGVNKNN